MKCIISFLFFFIFVVSFSQTLYLNKVSTVSKRTYKYHKTANKQKQIKRKHPLLIYVHGGGFSGGKRDDYNAIDFANNMASRGYAVASISYRLTMKNLGFGCAAKAEDKKSAFNVASEDISLAVKYLLKRKNKFRLNTNNIILIGSSAGAEAILNLVYVYNNKNSA
jgi:carboxylesterase type B